MGKNYLWYNQEPIPKTDLATAIDDRDKKTPDNWVPRHPELIRLTGKHPFNCEPPLEKLFEQGFITPPSLHYVRNHGYCPKGSWEDHELKIQGLVNTPLTLTMDELVAMPSLTIPVTLVCAGNRRKEQNMVKQTIGFNWGAAGHATGKWTGVRLSDILEKAGYDKEKARHVEFVGAEDLPNGKCESAAALRDWHSSATRLSHPSLLLFRRHLDRHQHRDGLGRRRDDRLPLQRRAAGA